MSANWGVHIELSIFGESHGKVVGVNIGHLPAGIKLDWDFINCEMSRRAPGKNNLSTSRKETDQVEIISGVIDDITTGAPLCAIIYNTSAHSKDYEELKTKMRPGHSDYPAYVKYQGFNDIRGGGHFSARVTAPLVFAGALCKLILKTKGIEVYSHILSIKDINDDHFPLFLTSQMIDNLMQKEYPVINDDIYKQMKERILEARKDQDSVGGKIECMVTGLPAGIGNPFFDSVESHLSSLLFSIPAVKAISFGDLDDITRYSGSFTNDAYYYEENKVLCKTNHNGGIIGGITNGMPLLFTLGIKPTPSISRLQDTVDISSHTNTSLKIIGRHDPCVVLRASVIVEAMTAIGLLDLLNI